MKRERDCRFPFETTMHRDNFERKFKFERSPFINLEKFRGHFERDRIKSGGVEQCAKREGNVFWNEIMGTWMRQDSHYTRGEKAQQENINRAIRRVWRFSWRN